MWYSSGGYILLCTVLGATGRPGDISPFLNAAYAKVARWGSTNENEGRSSLGQTPWTQSTNVQVKRLHNLSSEATPMKYSIVHAKTISNKQDSTYQENLPAKGEVMIEERFHPRPFIAYEAIGANNPPPYIQASKPPPKPAPTGFETYQFPSNPGNMDAPMSQDAMPPSKPTGFDTYQFPSNPSNVHLDLPPTNDTPNTSNPSAVTSLYNSPYSSYNPPPLPAPINFDGPKKPKVEMTKYGPPHAEKDKPPDMKFPTYLEYDPSLYKGHDHSMDGPPMDSVDEALKPGAPHHFDFGHLPEYLDYNPNEHPHHGHFFHHHHHPPVYHEVTTTTTPSPEKERVNKRPYTYYYLGRKLWYIPLYFSVYFIIYIFVLILKSIARHKVQFSHYFENDMQRRSSGDALGDLTQRVQNGIESAQRKYAM